MKHQNILLITATITPPSGAPNLARNNPSVRLHDYERALKFYLSLLNRCFDAIIFAENSNSDVSSLQNLVTRHGITDKVEFLTFYGLDYPPSYDRGYGEFKLVDYAMQHSKVINNGYQEGMIIWKITGRYIVKNLAQIVALQPSNFDLYCNFRNYPKRCADMFLLAWTLDGYQACLNNIYHNLRVDVPTVPAGTAVEERFRNLLDHPPGNIKLVRRFDVIPQLEGVRGDNNKGYSTDTLWKLYVRRTVLALLPWLWI